MRGNFPLYDINEEDRCSLQNRRVPNADLKTDRDAPIRLELQRKHLPDQTPVSNDLQGGQEVKKVDNPA